MAISQELENALLARMGSTSAGVEMSSLLNAVSALSGTEAGYLDSVTPGTAASSKAVVLGTSGEISTITTAEITNLAVANLKVAVTAVTAVGSVQSLATNSLVGGLNVITGGGTNLGVKLPAPVTGTVVLVKNATASAALIYGDVTATIINALATSTGYSVGAGLDTILVNENSTRWWTFPLVAS
jgi:hypothetical protein